MHSPGPTPRSSESASQGTAWKPTVYVNTPGDSDTSGFQVTGETHSSASPQEL